MSSIDLIRIYLETHYDFRIDAADIRRALLVLQTEQRAGKHVVVTHKDKTTSRVIFAMHATGTGKTQLRMRLSGALLIFEWHIDEPEIRIWDYARTFERLPRGTANSPADLKSADMFIVRFADRESNPVKFNKAAARAPQGEIEPPAKRRKIDENKIPTSDPLQPSRDPIEMLFDGNKPTLNLPGLVNLFSTVFPQTSSKFANAMFEDVPDFDVRTRSAEQLVEHAKAMQSLTRFVGLLPVAYEHQNKEETFQPLQIVQTFFRALYENVDIKIYEIENKLPGGYAAVKQAYSKLERPRFVAYIMPAKKSFRYRYVKAVDPTAAGSAELENDDGDDADLAPQFENASILFVPPNIAVKIRPSKKTSEKGVKVMFALPKTIAKEVDMTKMSWVDVYNAALGPATTTSTVKTLQVRPKGQKSSRTNNPVQQASSTAPSAFATSQPQTPLPSLVQPNTGSTTLQASPAPSAKPSTPVNAYLPAVNDLFGDF